MTWQKIIDTNNQEEYERKAEKAKSVFLLIDKRSPYLPIDYAYSVYEIAVKYGIPYNSVLTILHTGCTPRCYGFLIERVSLTDFDEADEAIA